MRLRVLEEEDIMEIIDLIMDYIIETQDQILELRGPTVRL